MKIKRKLLSVMLTGVMVVGMMPPISYAAEGSSPEINLPVFSDMTNNWSTGALNNAVTNGLLSGADGKISPNDNLTRAQMATVIARAFGATAKNDLKFADIKSTDWYADSLAIASQMNVIQGSDGKMNPNKAITRQEVFAVIARALKLQPATTINKNFADVNEISDWAKGDIYAIVNGGYIQGSNGKLNPKGLITRAEFAQTLDNILKQYIRTAGEYTTVAEGNIMVNTPNVTLKNVTVSGDLIIGDGVGNGEVTLDNVKVTGRMVVRGGGVNSIIITGTSNVSNVIVARIDGAVSVKVKGDANVGIVYIDDGSDDVHIEGTVGKVEIHAEDIVVSTIGANIKDINISAQNSKVIIDAKSKVNSVDINAAASKTKVEVAGAVATIVTAAANTEITGTGTVTRVEVQGGATDSKIETPKTQIVVSPGVTGITGVGGVQISGGTTVGGTASNVATTTPPTSGGGSSNGGGSGGGTTPEVADLTAYNATLAAVVKADYTQESWTIYQTVVLANVVTAANTQRQVNAAIAAIQAAQKALVKVEAPVVTEANVANLEQLKTALESEVIKTINITTSIPAITETLVVNHEVTINGGENTTLTFTDALNTLANGQRQGILVLANGTKINNLSVVMAGVTGWQGVYGIQVYKATEVTLKDVTARGADGGILVNASAVTLEGQTTVSDNEFGGIEVSNATADVLSNSVLTVTGTLVNSSEVYKQPTIWLVNDQGTVTGGPATTNTTIKADQTQYYLVADNAKAPVVTVANVATVEELKTALATEAIKTINVTEDISAIAEALVVNHAVTINGGGKTLTFTNALNELTNGQRQGILVLANGTKVNSLSVVMAGVTGWQGVYGIQVYKATEVTLKDVTARGADGGILVNASAVTLEGQTTVSDNEFGGIEVSKGSAEGLSNSVLTVTGTLVNDSEATEQPTIWLVIDQGEVESGLEFKNTTIDNKQIRYYLEEENAAPTPAPAP
ncbi:S-layer homology domain-containing protein [Paenibacillus macquariensis]|uniref:S-layer homology domain-containing protein n=2 Tax=Paenibacillus macquariensis TaxID=948756 RepID=A0ABY1K2U5_9BACL|nr:S-layer homology domain-containing protein [Paenibacillus macquariensis]